MAARTNRFAHVQAIRQINNDMCDQPVLSVIAAALRAAADQVIEEASPVEAILAIAAEPEGKS